MEQNENQNKNEQGSETSTEEILSAVGEEATVAPPDRIKSAYDWLEVICVSVAIVIFLFSFIARLSSVNGTSMLQTLEDGDRLIVSDLFYTPARGDVVAVQKESDFTKPLVKRVIATGGETVYFDFSEWEVSIRTSDGLLITLDEPYVNKIDGTVMKRYSVPYSNEITIPEGYVFVMGDNRNGSNDSRDSTIGLISENEILGHVLFRLTPLSKIGMIH